MWDWVWPDVSDQESAQRVIKRSFWTFAFLSFGLAVWAFLGLVGVITPFHRWALVDPGLFVIIAAGLYRRSSFASVAVVLCFAVSVAIGVILALAA